MDHQEIDRAVYVLTGLSLAMAAGLAISLWFMEWPYPAIN